jgi:hypothetical protein
MTGTAMPALEVRAAERESNGQVVTGTLDQLDLSQMKGSLKTDLGKPIFFEIVKPELFKGISVGERVTVQLDDKGRATKVIDMPVPELKKPIQ